MKIDLIQFRAAFCAFATTCAFVFSVLVASPLTAQSSLFASDRPLSADEAFDLEVEVRPDNSRVMTWQIADGYYLYRDKLDAQSDSGAAVPLQTSAGTAMDDPTFGLVEVYFDTALAEMGPVDGPVTLTWQGCQDGGICYPPVSETLAAVGGAAPAASSSRTGVALAQETGVIEGLQARGGTLMVLAGFLGFGLLLAFTPCVFPMFPILAGMLTGQGEGLTVRRGAALSGVYVLAMASAFGLLGVAAAWSGQNLQVVLQSPYAVYAVAAVFAVLALSMFGLFEMQLPQSWTRRLSSAGSQRSGTFAGAATLGFTSALVVGPCVTAPLAGALLYIAGTGDMMLGAAALFALGLGQGIPLMVVGTLGAQVLPSAGAWMDGVKTLFGFVFLGMAIWLVGRLVPGPVILALWAALLVGAGVFTGAMDLLPPDTGPARRSLKVGGVLSMLAGAIMAVGAALGGHDPLRPLSALQDGSADPAPEKLAFHSVRTPDALEAAIAAQADTPTLVYVTADWCVTCRAIERDVWADVGLQAVLADVNRIAVDVTAFGNDGQQMLDRLGAVGPPTMVFLDRDKVEPLGTRIVGDTEPDVVRASVEAVR